MFKSQIKILYLFDIKQILWYNRYFYENAEVICF